MPVVKISLRKGRSEDFKKTILDTVHESLVQALKIPDNDRIQRLVEFDPTCFEAANKNADDFIIIEITLFKGRSLSAKKSFYSTCVERLSDRTGVDANDIVIILNEVEAENWGIRGGKPASEVDLGFKIDV